MDVHQRISGAFMAVLGGFGLLVGLIMLGKFLEDSLGASLPNTVSAWLLCALVAAVLLWCAAALLGGLAATLGRSGARLLLVPAALPLLILFPFGSLVGVYTLWAYWRKDTPPPLPAWKRIALQRQQGA